MKKSDLNQIPQNYQSYIELVDDLPIVEALKYSLIQFQEFDWDKVSTLGDVVYEKDKWTIKQIIQHIIDWERIFTYRTLIYARMDENRPLPHDENLLAANSKANEKSWSELKEDFILVRNSTISLFQSFDHEDLKKKAFSQENLISVLVIGFLIVGHQLHHFKIIEERYFS